MIADTLNIEIQKVSQSKLQELSNGALTFGRMFSDHMFVTDYDNGEWMQHRILPYGKMEMSPASLVLHYGQAIFEGMKAFKGDDGKLRTFRPEDNWARLNKSAVRMCMPEIPKELFLQGLNTLLDMDREWAPHGTGHSLYLRPTMYASDEYIGVKESQKYRFFIITSPVGSYYKEPVKVKVETHYTRACIGGTGSAKAAGNYAASLYPAKMAKEEGYHQLLWTDAKEHKYLEESGTMNVMFVIDGKLLTPDLTDTILPGITRDSVLTIARDWGMNVEERRVSVEEVMEATQNGTLQEAFGVGTAATIAHISHIGYNGTDHELPPVADRQFSNKVYDYLEDLRNGRVEDKWGWCVEV